MGANSEIETGRFPANALLVTYGWYKCVCANFDGAPHGRTARFASLNESLKEPSTIDGLLHAKLALQAALESVRGIELVEGNGATEGMKNACMAMALKKRWGNMPLQELLAALDSKTSGKVVRIDTDLAAPIQGVAQTDLYFDFTL